MKTRQFEITENGRTEIVIIPEGDDKSYTDYIEEAQREKVTAELKSKPPAVRTKSKEEVAGALKEYNEYKKHRAEGYNKKYY